MRSVMSAIKSLKITVDDIVQYFVWSGLNSFFQTQLTGITNKSKPSLDDINTNIFEATNRYVKQMNEKNPIFQINKMLLRRNLLNLKPIQWR